ncbi:MAG: DUF2905 domain-containing protein [Nitrospira sp. LK265]|nr:DUF2905 domain-containing protein [Nitrospira sp. LK265]
MPEWSAFGKVLIGLGLGIVALGALLVAVDRLPGLGNVFSWLGKLPGDISIKRDNFSFYFPVATSIVLSILLSLLFYLVGWFFRR